MNRCVIRKSTEQDIDAMLELFRQAKQIMRSDGNMHQWTGNYPSADVIRADIGRDSSYVICNDMGEVIGTFAFIIGPDPTYSYIEGGQWLDDSRTYGTIHRLASGPKSHGIARECFDWCWDMVPNLRVDTHADNRIMQHCIQRAGFTYCGIIYIADGTPRLAYQKCSLDN